MSIVYDYLRQVKSRTDLHEQETDPYAPVIARPQPERVHRSLWLGWAAGGFLAVVITAAGIFFALRSSDRPGPAPSDQIPRMAPKSGTADTRTQLGYILEGIIFNPVKPFAIINGAMLEVGEQVGDAEVTSITPNTVLLKNIRLNREIALKL